MARLNTSSSSSETLNETTPLIPRPIIVKVVTETDEPIGPETDQPLLEGYVPGQSTFLQTLLNMLGDLLGTGLLACPIAMAHLGWVLGPIILGIYCATTMFTMIGDYATIPRLSVVAYRAILGDGSTPYSSGKWDHTHNVGLIVLFSETLHVLLPWRSSNEWKIIGLIVYAVSNSIGIYDRERTRTYNRVMPATFPPLRYLAFTSSLGVIAICTLVGVLLHTGMTSHTSPGSLFVPAPTDILPSQGFPKAAVAVGLFLMSFGGHGLVPNLVHDMAKPQYAIKAIQISYGICTVIYFIVACVGYRMYGRDVSDAVSKDLVHFGQTSPVVIQIAVWMVCVTPLTKIPLGIRPLSDTMFTILRLHPHVPSSAPTPISNDIENAQLSASSASSVYHSTAPVSERLKTILRPLLRLLLLVVLTALSFFIPRFESIQGFQGCYFGGLMLIVLPILAGGRVLGWREKVEPGERGKGRLKWMWIAVALGWTGFALVGGVCAAVIGGARDGPPVLFEGPTYVRYHRSECRLDLGKSGL